MVIQIDCASVLELAGGTPMAFRLTPDAGRLPIGQEHVLRHVVYGVRTGVRFPRRARVKTGFVM
jgi:hypothetical protein